MRSGGFKVLALVVIWVLNLVASACPFVFNSRSWVSKAESLAGGIFIGSALIHLIPESLHSFEVVSRHPLAPFISLGCFTVLLCIEVLVESHHQRSDSTELLRSSEGAPYAAMAPGRISPGSWVLFHGFVEAIAFGVIESMPVLLALFCAIIGHKPVETFALGLRLLRDRPTKAVYFAMMAIFSSVAPLTICLTMEIGRNASRWFFAVVTSASAGAFLFVGCHELGEIIHHAGNWALDAKLIHLGCFAVGALWMAAFALVGGEHDHDH
jgi:zinc transporter 1/2/3